MRSQIGSKQEPSDDSQEAPPQVLDEVEEARRKAARALAASVEAAHRLSELTGGTP
ncbi:hypothetical protein [Streptomyces yaizuensis]|uniref:hypothetical protein n=1 Tax=Streptomyces yaizuensis TaxID=2989713 RepID=UPI002B200A93|nr:hypothetical protein [Streptomyces sp. YSPA8]